MKWTSFIGLFSIVISWAGSLTAADNVILFIGDGMGFEQVKAARCFNGGPLSFEGFAGQADCTTYSADNAITDSAAAGTAIATAFKVNNGVISLALPGGGRDLETLLEFYQKRGKKVGLITTTYLTHATPATFGAHTSSRNNTTEIGADFLNQTRPNLLFGGGGYGLDASAAAAAGYLVATDTTGFDSLESTASHLAALFGSGYLPYEYDYLGGSYPYPQLPNMVAKALAALANEPNGFFLMVEAGMIDQACHANHLARSIHETLALSRAIQAARDWAGDRSDTMILVTADHETGGLTVTGDNGSGNYPAVKWSTTGHTAANVPVYAWGRNAELVQGTLDNTDFFNLLTAENAYSPVLARVTATVVDETSVLVTWLTDVAATSQVEYGPSPADYVVTVTDDAPVTTHSVLLSGLTAGQQKYYRVTSQGSAALATSAEYTFTPVSLQDPGLLVTAGSAWRYNDTGTDLGTAWREPTYDDALWKTGLAQLGYGDGDEATVISYGANASQKHPCYYFRHSFSIDHPDAYTNLSLSILRDDGAVVYLNGTEVARYNIPSGTISYGTWASSASDFGWDAAMSIPNQLVAGVNVLAVEIHQASASSSDVSLDLQLTATRLDYDVTPPVISAVTVAEVTDHSAIVTWTTDEPAASRVHYGLSEDFGLETGSGTLVTDHRVVLTGLGANTTYFFVVESADASGNTGFGPESSFNTLMGTAPSAPADLTATAQSSTTILLTWTDTSANESGFELYQSLGSGELLVGTTASDVTSALVTGLLPGTSYTYFVRAFNGTGGANSTKATATTFAPPVAHNQNVSTSEDTALTITLVGTDADGDPLIFSTGTPPSNGTLGPISGNQVTYAPNANYFGPDNFTFLAYDGTDCSLPATVTISVAAVNDPPVANPDTASTLQGLSVIIDVVGNDTDADGDPLIVVGTSQGTSGTVSINPDYTVTYRPNVGFTGQDVFTYTASDGPATSVATVTVTVNPNLLFSDGFESGNFTAGGWLVSGTCSIDTSARYAGSYGALLKKASAITKSLYSVGADSVHLSYARRAESLEAGETGIVEFSSDNQRWTNLETLSGTTTWEAKEFEVPLSGPDLHLRFRVNGNAGNDIFMVDEIAVTGGSANGAPIATADTYSVPEDTSLTVLTPGVLANDTDPEGNPLSAVLVSGPANGTLILNPDGYFSYVPSPNFNGTDSFSYQASDGSKASAATTVTITVTAVNDAPNASDDAYSLGQNTTLTVQTPGVLGNDTDLDGDLLTASVLTGPANGELTLNANGYFTYTPKANYTGGDSFTYTVTDGNGGTATAAVVITVQSQGGGAIHVSSILVLSLDAGKGLKRGYAEVVIVDADQNPVPGASVAGSFSGGITETVNATAGTDGKAVLQTTRTVSGRPPQLTFCVNNVILTDRTYTPAANVETCDKNY